MEAKLLGKKSKQKRSKNWETIASYLTGTVRTMALYKESLSPEDRISLLQGLIKTHEENPIPISNILIEEITREIEIIRAGIK